VAHRTQELKKRLMQHQRHRNKRQIQIQILMISRKKILAQDLRKILIKSNLKKEMSDSLTNNMLKKM